MGQAPSPRNDSEDTQHRRIHDLLPRVPSSDPRAFPDLQLNYLERTLEEKTLVSDQLKLKYLELVCKAQPDKCVFTLKSYNFPLDDSFAICEKYHNLPGMAHIKYRTRNIDDALKIYLKIMQKSFEDYMDQPQIVPLTNEQPDRPTTQVVNITNSTYLSDGLFSYRLILEICEAEVEEMYEEGKKLFEKFLQFILELFADFEKKEEAMLSEPLEMLVRYRELKDFIKTQIFDDFLINYTKRVGTTRLIEVA